MYSPSPPQVCQELTYPSSATGCPLIRRSAEAEEDEREVVSSPQRGIRLIAPIQLLIKETYYPEWLANPVLVKKNGKRRVCIDFTNLNQASLKDSFPLPRIDPDGGYDDRP